MPIIDVALGRSKSGTDNDTLKTEGLCSCIAVITIEGKSRTLSHLAVYDDIQRYIMWIQEHSTTPYNTDVYIIGGSSHEPILPHIPTSAAFIADIKEKLGAAGFNTIHEHHTLGMMQRSVTLSHGMVQILEEPFDIGEPKPSTDISISDIRYPIVTMNQGPMVNF